MYPNTSPLPKPFGAGQWAARGSRRARQTHSLLARKANGLQHGQERGYGSRFDCSAGSDGP